MEYQIDYTYKNGAANFAKAFDAADMIAAIEAINWDEVAAISVFPWKD